MGGGAPPPSHSGPSSHDNWDNHHADDADDVWSSNNGAVASRIHGGALSSSKPFSSSSSSAAASALSGTKSSTPVIPVNLDEIDLTQVEDPYKLLPPIDASVLIDWTNDDNDDSDVGRVDGVDSSVRGEELKEESSPSKSRMPDAAATAPDVADEDVVPETLLDAAGSSKEAAAVEVDVAEETIDKMVKEKWSGVNGCYDDAGDWRDWTQIIALSSYGGDDINILPYVDIDS